jgi:hypothetical protein
LCFHKYSFFALYRKNRELKSAKNAESKETVVVAARKFGGSCYVSLGQKEAFTERPLAT